MVVEFFAKNKKPAKKRQPMRKCLGVTDIKTNPKLRIITKLECGISEY